MNTKELTEAVNLLMEKDEERREEKRQQQIDAEEKRQLELESNVANLAGSVNVIKWCIISMTTVMFLSIVTVVLIVIEVEREAERIKGQVQEIQREAELIRDKIRHPLETAGSALGRKLEEKIGEAFSGKDN